ncbi:MAG: ATP-binding protein [Desulfomonile tiedjei]|uniref:ATP-binding protein n=1 Tax=Desulfomonile tiedjei TaxID=2358 RepID=A0A9D6V3B3_9BACT|nr:ATP-binding protein [Desulfomonile tiedjei]
MDETLIIERLGPIKKLEIKPRRLTIIIGEQASGKSLVAQILYFFRELKAHLARIYNPELISGPDWHNHAIRQILDSLRGVPFGHFANGVATLRYTRLIPHIDWILEIDGESLSAKVPENLIDRMDKWVQNWQRDPSTLGRAQKPRDIFIPTERGLIPMLVNTQPGVLYDPNRPMPLREFALILNDVLRMRRERGFVPGWTQDTVDAWRKTYAESFVLQCQRNALGGEAIFVQTQPEKWVWKVDSKELPITATSSGQMETWPFFEIAILLENAKVLEYVYFEEPETHVHPRAQVEIMKVVAYLVNRGHNFVITTHSPFLLQVVDNMLQRFMKNKGQIREGEERWLNPEKVAAYCLRRDSDQSPEDIMDRENTRLLDITELEKVSNELGAEFDELLYGTE